MSASSVWLLLAVLVTSCEVDDRPQYSIVLLNTGAAEIADAAVKYAGFKSLGGVLIPNAEKGQSGVKVPVPDTVVVVWRTKEGKPHEQNVQVRGSRPFRQMLVTIDGDTATVVLK